MKEPVICEHGLTEFCSCVERRPPVNLYDGHREAWTLKREGWRCQCMRPGPMQGEGWQSLKPVMRNKRHTEPFECLKPEVLAIWTALHPEPAAILSARSQKRLAHLWLWFSQDVEAKRLSGRA